MSSAQLTDLEKYLRGVPLSEENAALMEGREPAAELPYSEGEAKAAELTGDDRAWLRRLINEPGFTVLLRLLNLTIAKREDSAKLLSSVDPLGNKDQVVHEWAYIACYKAIMFEIQQIVKNAIVD